MCVFPRVPYPCSLHATPLASLQHESGQSSWLSLIVARHIRAYAVVGLTTSRKSYVIQLLPSPHNLVLGQIQRRSSCPWHKIKPPRNRVLIGPMFLQSRHMRAGQPIPCATVVLDCQHTMPAMGFGTPLWGIPIAPRRNHMLHTFWTAACYHCNVMCTPWRHTLEASHPACPRMSGNVFALVTVLLEGVCDFYQTTT